MIKIKINTLGQVTNGDMCDWFILIKEDLITTGGYYVIQSPNIKFEDIVYDNWFLSLREVEQYLQGYKIKWLLDKPSKELLL